MRTCHTAEVRLAALVKRRVVSARLALVLTARQLIHQRADVVRHLAVHLARASDHATVADKKVSIRKAGRIAETVTDFAIAKEIFEKLYPDCELLEISAKRSSWTAGVYIAAEMRKRGGT